MRTPEGLNTLYSGIGKHPLVVRMTGNSITLFGKVLTSSFQWLEKSLSGYHMKSSDRRICIASHD